MYRPVVLVSFVCALVAASSLLAPHEASAQELTAAEPTPFDTTHAPRTMHHVDRGLTIAGATILSIGWGLNTIGALPASYLLDSNGSFDTNLYWVSLVPVIGPVIWGGAALSDEDGGDVVAAFAFVDAAVQGLGLALLIAGLVGVDEPIGEVADGVRVLPFAGGERAGVSLDARW